MTATIQTDEGAAGTLAEEVRGALGEYPSFTLLTMSGLSPVSASAIHDGFSVPIKNALDTWSDLIVSDAQALMSIASELKSLDEAQARQLLGIEEKAL